MPHLTLEYTANLEERAPDPDLLLRLGLQITVEVQDIRKATYFKDPPGTLGPPSLSLI